MKWRQQMAPRGGLRTVWHIGLLACCAIASVSGQVDSEPTPQEKQRYTEAIGKLVDAQHGRIHLRGEVVDEQNQRVSGVGVELEKTRLTNFGEASETDTESVIINGTFDLTTTGYAAVRATFSKSGYYSRRVEFFIRLTGEQGWRAALGQAIDPQLLTKEGLRIVLEKVGALANLNLYGGLLEYEASGKGRVFSFDQSPIGNKALQFAPNVHEANLLPTNCAYFLADRNSDGTIALIQIPRSHGQNNLGTFPRRLTLIMNDANGGFLLFRPAVNKNVYHQMKQTPEVGYQRQLVLETEETLVRSNDIYFFFKTGGKYGKGSIGDIVAENGEMKVLLGVAFRLQSDGSRNVETDEGVGENYTPVATTADATPPTITVLGSSPATVECHGNYTDAGATATDDKDGNLTRSIVASNTVNTAATGAYTVIYSVADAAGNHATATRTVTVVDTAPPQITCPGNLTVGCSTNLETPVSFIITATDACDPQPAITTTPTSGSAFRVGTTTVTATASDASGNTNSCTFTVTRAPLGFTGFLAPIGGADATGGTYANPVRTFKLKSTVPVKFTASCAGTAITGGVHTLQVIKYNDATTAADPLDATPTDAATTGNQFRLTNDEWHFNLDTKATGMTAGTWLLRATLSDGSVHSAWIALK